MPAIARGQGGPFAVDARAAAGPPPDQRRPSLGSEARRLPPLAELPPTDRAASTDLERLTRWNHGRQPSQNGFARRLALPTSITLAGRALLGVRGTVTHGRTQLARSA